MISRKNLNILMLWGLQTVFFNSSAMEVGCKDLVTSITSQLEAAGGNIDLALPIFLQAAHMMQQPASTIIEGVNLLFQHGVSGNACLESMTNLTNNPRPGVVTFTRKIPIIRDFTRQCAREEKAVITLPVRIELIRLCLQHGADVNNCATEILESHVDLTYEEMHVVRQTLNIPAANAATMPLLIDYLRNLKKEDGTYRSVNFELVTLLLNAGYDLNTLFEEKTILQELEVAIAQNQDNVDLLQLRETLQEKMAPQD